MISTIVILAGGLATRLYPVTKEIPKSMIDVAGKPFICHQLKLLKEKGIEKVVLCVGHLGEQIKDYIKDGNNFGLYVDYSFDGEKLLGTGGAIKKAVDKLDEVFFVMYGDSYLDVDYGVISDFFNENDKKGLMTVLKNDNKWDKSNVIFNEGKIIKYNKTDNDPKMHYIDFGLSILKRDCFNKIDDEEIIDLANIFKDLITQNEMLGFEVFNRFYEIGTFKGLEETIEYIKNKTSI